jgi:bacterial leucyl aminopeptidase
VARLTFLVDGAAVGSVTSAPWSTAWNAKKSPLGARRVVVRVVDVAGTATDATATVTLTK